MISSKQLKEVRDISFAKKLKPSKKLAKLIDGLEGDAYKFLQNPAALNTYLYLCDFVKEYSEIQYPDRKAKILDWGSGKGQVSLILKDLRMDVTSADVDWDEHQDLVKKSKLDITKLEHDYKLPFRSESFDIVLSFGVLEHVPNDIQSLKEINRVLKDDGSFLCFNLPYKTSYRQQIAHMMGNFYHDRLYSKSQVVEKLDKTGFALIGKPWHRQLFPKNSINYPSPNTAEAIDQSLTKTPLKYLANSIEFAAVKI